MTALTDPSQPNSGQDQPDEQVSIEHARQRIQHHRAQRTERRDPARALSRKRARDEMPLRT